MKIFGVFRKKLPQIIKMKGGSVLLHQKRRINKATAFMIFFKTGSQYDGELNGICHFAEHLLLKETKYMSLEQVREKHKELGSEMNGSTGAEILCFHINSANNKLEESLKLLSDQVFEPGFNEDSFNKERDVVLKEIARAEDEDRRTANSAVNAIAMPESYFIKGNYVNLGTKETLNKISIEDIRNLENSQLTLDNLVVSVAGNISVRKAKRLANKYVVSRIENRNGKLTNHNFNFEYAKNSTLKIVANERANAHIRIMFPMSLDKTHADNIALNPISYILNGLGGLLYKVLRDERGLVYSCGGYFDNQKKYSHFIVWAESAPDKVNDILLAVKEVFARLKMTEEKLEEFKDKEQINKDKAISPDHRTRAGRNYNTFNYYGKFEKMKKIDKIVKSLTAETVNSYIDKIKKQKKVFVSVVGNVAEKDIMKIEDIEKLYF